MDNIISIDLDIIMSPHIGIYNHFVNAEIPYEANWKFLNGLFVKLDDFKINQLYYQTVKKIIDVYAPQVETIYVGYDHSSILDAINLERDKLSLYPIFDIYNIDYHHDIIYGDAQKLKIFNWQTPDCACWVGYLSAFNYIRNYNWYRGEGSICDENIIKKNGLLKFNFEHKILEYNNFPLNLQDVKVLYLAISAPWIPPHLLDKIKSIYSSYNNIYYLPHPYFTIGDEKEFLNGNTEFFRTVSIEERNRNPNSRLV